MAGITSPQRSQLPACWTNGERVSDRSEFLEQLQQGRHGNMSVAVVQPHVSEAMYRRTGDLARR